MNKKTLIIMLVAVLVLANIGVFVYLFISNKQAQVQTALVAQQQEQQRQKEEADQAEKARAAKEIEDIKNGLSKMIGGKIESVDAGQKSFVIDLDPLGNHERYTIRTNEQTEYSMVYVDTISDGSPIPEEADPGEDQGSARVEEKNFDNVGFEALKEGAEAQVEFPQRIDINSTGELVAQKITILYYKNFVE